MAESVLAIDVGERRVGVAIGDPTLKLAVPVGTFERAKGAAEAKLLDLIRDRGVKTVVVGLPVDQHGARTAQCERVESFARRLERRAAITLKFHDEYLTSESAKQRLGNSSHRDDREKGMVDAVAASIILQSYFDQCG